MKYLLILFLIGCSSVSKHHVKSIIDGDSFYIDNGKEIRLAEIDAPEYTHGHYQAYGLQAKEYLYNLIAGKTVSLKKVDTDKYGRWVCEVYADSVWINEALVNAGLCWVYPQYGSEKLYYEQLRAKQNKIGLWADNNPVSPYNFRHKRK